MISFSHEDRSRLLGRLSAERYDLIVIGGGITGTGIALDAASRGIRTLLVEMQDFAAGTSSRSTKLVHGGLRYLKQLEVKLVSDVGKERAVVYANAPHVTHPEWMLLPFYKNGSFGSFSTSLGLQVYDFLAGVKKSERRTMLTKTEVMEHEPLLKRDDLLGGGEYVEYRTDDARLTIEAAKKAREEGADLLNYTKVTGFLSDEGGSVTGVELVDVLTGRQYDAHAPVVVNAAGPWVEQVLELDRPGESGRLLLTKGVHLVFDRNRLPLHQPVYFDTPDGRMIFAIPRLDKTYVGTTDTVYEEDLIHPGVTEEDRRYILTAISEMFPQAGIRPADIESSWSGVRPLIRQEGKGPSEISRKDEIWEADSGLLTVAGGKLTGYRKMAEDVTDLVSRKLRKFGIQAGPCMTATLALSGGAFSRPEDYPVYVEDRARELVKLGISYQDGLNIASMYGTNTNQVAEGITRVQPAHGLPLAIRLTLQYAIDFEMAMTPSDYLIRRTGALYFHIDWVKKWKEQVTAYMAERLGWDDGERRQHMRELDDRISDAIGK
ncbi:glycerol-3-phosphate dehydrogenase/oxidase [Sporosarcina koreensis]|uniref:glycerol-3-phosphate dehydrogenase/oxidase n=1 Tax=Sporosarcina koreensis TaxID=334735 RepID=UPI00058F7252|nr:FAD-dependent oxidoreductase [Sporosarcina koreensis]